MVEMARFIKPILAHHPARSRRASTRARCLPARPASLARFQALPRAPAGGVRPAHDHERGGLPRPVVRDRPAQGDDVRVGDHRHVPGRPRPGTAYVLLHHYMGEIDGAFRAWGIPKGGTGGVSNAIARRGPRARGRDPDRGAGRADHRSATGAPTGVVLESGEEIAAPTRSCRRSTPAGTFLDLLEPGTLEPTFEEEVRRFKFRGSSGKVNLALDGLPDFTLPAGRRRAPPRRDLVLAVARRHGAGLRRRQVRPLQPASRTST